jgi:hypothetical protein
MSRSIFLSRFDGQARGLPPAPHWAPNTPPAESRRRLSCAHFSASAARQIRLCLGHEGKHKSADQTTRNRRRITRLLQTGLVPPVRLRPSCESGRMDSVRCFVPPTRRREGRTMRLDGQHPPPVREGFLHPRTVQRLTNNLPRAPARGVMPTVRNRPAGRPRDQGWLANLRRPDLREWPTQEDSESGSLGRRSPPIVRRLATGSKRPGYFPKASMNFTKPRTSW